MLRSNYFPSIIGAFAIFCVKNSFAQNRNICDICECIPSLAEPSYVNCNCRKSKPLILKDEDGDILANTKTLNISACNFVSFPANGLPKSNKLKSVQIKQVNLFHLNSGAFPYVVNLNVEDVGELIVDSFQGQPNLAYIDVKNSVLSNLTKGSFKDVNNLEKLSFYNVTINNIASQSLIIPSSNRTKPWPWLKFVNCKINIIQPDGISLQVSKLEIINTNINVINANGMSVVAQDSIDIIRSTFGAAISSDSFQFKSNKININDNEFESLPSLLLANAQLITNDKKINFVNNTIRDVDLGGFLLHSRLDKINFVKNKILCDCTPRKTSILKVKEVFPGLLNNVTNFDAIIEHNSCKNYNSITLSEFKRKFLARVVCNETETEMLVPSPDREQHDVDFNSSQNSAVQSAFSSPSYIFVILLWTCLLTLPLF